MNIYDQLVQVRRAQPFQPFSVVLRDGQRVDVTRRLQFATNGKKLLILDARDASHFYDLTDIDHIELLETAA